MDMFSTQYRLKLASSSQNRTSLDRPLSQCSAEDEVSGRIYSQSAVVEWLQRRLPVKYPVTTTPRPNGPRKVKVTMARLAYHLYHFNFCEIFIIIIIIIKDIYVAQVRESHR